MRSFIGDNMIAHSRFHRLDATQITATIERLKSRIEERFPGSGLGRVCGELLAVSTAAGDRAEEMARPMIGLRLGAAVLIAFIVLGLVGSAFLMKRPAGEIEPAQFIQLLESAINDVLLIGAAIFFLVTIEGRLKRNKAMKALHELRSIAHIIDMHQLTKDPERLLARSQATPSSPRPAMTAFELSRYLDYCSEMLSLVGKIAALYVRHLDDAVALAAVNEIEALTTGLSGKIWQKLTILHSWEFRSAPGPPTQTVPDAADVRN